MPPFNHIGTMTTHQHPNDFDISGLEPIDIKDLLYIDKKSIEKRLTGEVSENGYRKKEEECYLLVVWSNNKQAYVPYKFVREHYPLLILHYYASHTKFRRITDN